MPLHHDTITLERTFPVPAARLFQAFADPREREVWSAPSADTEVRIDSSDMRSGGREAARCGVKGAMKWRLNVTYHLVDQDRLITFTEELRDGDDMLTIALISVEFAEVPDGTHLKIIDQVASFVGPDGVAGHREGYTKALENLQGLLVPA